MHLRTKWKLLQFRQVKLMFAYRKKPHSMLFDNDFFKQNFCFEGTCCSNMIVWIIFRWNKPLSNDYEVNDERYSDRTFNEQTDSFNNWLAFSNDPILKYCSRYLGRKFGTFEFHMCFEIDEGLEYRRTYWGAVGESLYTNEVYENWK